MQKQQAIISLATRLLTVAAGFFTSILTSRYLGPAGRGDYFVIVTLSAIIVQFANLGLQSSNVYYLAQNRQLLPALISNSIWISILLGGCVSALVIGFYGYFSGSQIALNHLLYLLPLAPASLFYLLATNLLVGLNAINLYNLVQIISNVFVALLILSACLLKLDVGGFLLVNSAGWVIVMFLLVGILYKQVSPSAWQVKFNFAIFNKTFQYALKAYVTCLLGYLALKSNIFFLNYYVSRAELGYFSIASQINDAMIILPSTIGLLLFPHLVQQQQNRYETAKKHTYIMALLMTGFCLIVALLAKPFIVFIFGQQFAPSVPILWSILPGTLFFGIITILSQYLSALGFPPMIIWSWAITLIIVTILSALLVPTLGGVGAGIALSIGYFVLLLFVIWLVRYLSKKKHLEEVCIHE